MELLFISYCLHLSWNFYDFMFSCFLLNQDNQMKEQYFIEIALNYPPSTVFNLIETF